MDTHTVGPALTPEIREGGWAIYVEPDAEDGRGGLTISVDHGRTPRNGAGLGLTDDQTAALARLCNTALPDGDGRKITRADVARLEHAADEFDNEWSDGEPTEGATSLRRIAAKLAALLPPEEH